MKRIAIVMRSMVRGGEANSLSQIYEKIDFYTTPFPLCRLTETKH